MREILFRGKRCDNGEWVQGCLVKFGKESFTDDDRYGIMDKTVLVAKTHKNHCGRLVFGYCDYVYHNIRIAEIIPKSVGQFTGLTDKNGKKVFEGDIIRSDNGKQWAVSVVKFGKYVPKMFYRMFDMFSPGRKHLPSVGFYAKTVDKGEEMILFQSPCMTVIGNIHDNPELLAVTDNA